MNYKLFLTLIGIGLFACSTPKETTRSDSKDNHQKAIELSQKFIKQEPVMPYPMRM